MAHLGLVVIPAAPLKGFHFLWRVSGPLRLELVSLSTLLSHCQKVARKQAHMGEDGILSYYPHIWHLERGTCRLPKIPRWTLVPGNHRLDGSQDTSSEDILVVQVYK